jgi:predicted dehydrogenase
MKAAIVGCGAIAHNHAKSILSLGHELVALADIDSQRLAAFSETYGGKTYPSLETMLENEQFDVLHICTPHNLHVPMALQALDKGVNVFMEKPPVINEAQHAQLWEAYNAHKAKLGFCFQNRYNPPAIKALEILRSGEAGKVLGARSYVTWNRGAEYYSDAWHGTLEQEGGGVLINQSIHSLDLVNFLVDQTPVSVDAVMANHRLKTEIEVEDTMSALITYPDLRFSFYATNAYVASPPPMLEIFCENLTLRIEGSILTKKQGKGPWEQIEVQVLESVGKSYWGPGHISCIGDYYSSILENRPFALELPRVDDTIRLMLKVYQSARENRTVAWEE